MDEDKVAKYCTLCGKPSSNLSTRHKCPECAKQRIIDSIEQMRRKEGKIYEKWNARYEEGFKRREANRERRKQDSD